MGTIKSYEWTRNKRIVLIIYILLVGVIIYPSSLSIFSQIVGHNQATAGCHVWVLWWAQQGLANIQSDFIFFPYGADVVKLYGSDLLSPLLFSWIPISPVFLYNIWIWFLLVFGAMGIRELSIYERSSPSGAFVAGVIFLSAPFFLHEMLNGTSEILSFGFVPWFFLFLRKTFQENDRKSPYSLGLFAGLSLMSSVYNAFFILLLTMLLVIGKACNERESIFSLEILKRVLHSLFIFAPFLIFVSVLHLSHGATETLSRRENWMAKEFFLPDSYASLEDWFDPRDIELPVVISLPDGSEFEYWTLSTVYIGWVTIIFALMYFWKNRGIYFWSSLIAMLIASGPYIRLHGKVILDNFLLPLPTIVYLFPLFSIVALHAYRFASIVVLGFAVGASKQVKSPWWAGVIFLEALAFSPVPFPTATIDASPSTALLELRDAEEGAVLSIPLATENLHHLSQALVAQTQHHKPIQDGGIHRRIGNESTKLFRENELVSAMAFRTSPYLIDQKTARKSADHLCSLGFRYLLISREYKEMEMWAEAWLGSAKSKDDKWIWWLFPSCTDKENL